MRSSVAPFVVAMVCGLGCGPAVDLRSETAGGSPGEGGGGAAGNEPCGDTSADSNNCGFCGHDCLGSACVDGFCEPLHLGDDEDPVDMALGSEHLYYNVDSFVWGGGTVLSVPKLGGGPSEFAAPGYSWPGAIVADASDVYWTTMDLGTVLKAPAGGGDWTTLYSAPKGNWTRRIAVDATSVYFTVGAEGTELSNIMTIPRNGGGATTLGSYAVTVLAVDASSIYWASRDSGTLMKMPRSGGTPTILASDLRELIDIAVDDSHVYCVSSAEEDGSILKIPSSGGDVQVLADGLARPLRVVVDETSVYFTTAGNSGAGFFGTVSRVSKSGGASMPLASANLAPLDLVVDDTSVYVGVARGVLKIAK